MRRFELVEGSASKFWEVEVRGAEVVVRFGRIGSDGQTRRSRSTTRAAAAHEADKLVREKLGKGYAEVGGAPPGGRRRQGHVAAPAGAPKKEVAAMPVPGRGAGDDREPGQHAFTRTPGRAIRPRLAQPARARRRGRAGGRGQASGAGAAGADPYLPTILKSREVALASCCSTPFHPSRKSTPSRPRSRATAPSTRRCSSACSR
ncbi:MAG: WGR domain-containing protein [Myxococcota bacterium]